MPLRSTSLITLFGLCLALSAAGLQAQTAPTPASTQAPLPTIAALDVPRYMGRWYEIAKFPNWFQRKCVADTSANYQLLADGSVEVLNQCRQKNGEMQQALGAARQIEPARYQALLGRLKALGLDTDKLEVTVQRGP